MRAKRAFFVLEYAALIAVIAFALIAMKVYLKRAFMGKYRALSDEIGEQYDPSATILNSSENTHMTSSEYTAYDGSEPIGSVETSTVDTTTDSNQTIN